MAADNLKARVTADTSDFKKGMREASTALKSFEKQGSSALSGISGMLGGASGALGDLGRNIQNATSLFSQLGRNGKGALSEIGVAVRSVGGAIAGLGITAAIIQFKELNREAEQFGRSLQGANMVAAGKAYRETYRATLDELDGNGKSWAERWNRFQNGFSTMVADFMHRGATPEMMAEAERKGNTAADLASEMVDLTNRQSDSLVDIQRYQSEINEQLLVAWDRSQGKAERDAAQARAVELVNRKYDEQIALQKAIADNLARKNALNDVTTTPEDLRNQRQAEAQVLALEAQRDQELTSMKRLENQISGSMGSQATSAKETKEATVLTVEAAKEMVLAQRELKRIQDQNAATMRQAKLDLDFGGSLLPKMGGVPGMPTLPDLQRKDTPGFEVSVMPVLDKEAMMDFTDTLVDGVASMSEALGGLVGDLITGGDAFGNFKNAALSAFADMAISVGKMALATGAATAGIKAALESLNPYAAMAAGAALVALGTAVKSGLSNVASGNYSASVASSGYSGAAQTPSSFGREMEVRVTGTLTANGSKLVAVLNNESDRRSYTT